MYNSTIKEKQVQEKTIHAFDNSQDKIIWQILYFHLIIIITLKQYIKTFIYTYIVLHWYFRLTSNGDCMPVTYNLGHLCCLEFQTTTKWNEIVLQYYCIP